MLAAFVASEPVFAAVKLAGAAYLVLLGLQARVSAHSVAPARALRQGLLNNLGNPKLAVFFTSLLPQFAADPNAMFTSLLLLGLVFCLLTLTWLSLYAAAVAKAGDLLRRPRIRRALEGVTGAVSSRSACGWPRESS